MVSYNTGVEAFSNTKDCIPADIQKDLKPADSVKSSPTRAQPAAPSFHNQILVQQSSFPTTPSTSHPTTGVSRSGLPSSPQESYHPVLPLKQNISSRPSDDQIPKEIQLHLRSLKAKENSWGPEHITTLDTVNTLGKLYAKQGKVVEAEEMYMRALSGFEKALGKGHDTTLKVSINLQELRSLTAAQRARDIH